MRVTREEYLDLEDDGYKYDMLQGVLHMAPSPSFSHGEAQGSLHYLLKLHLKKNKVGRAALEVDVFLPDGGDVLRPDISFVLNENVHIIKTHIHGAPDLIIELLSERTEKRDRNEKANRYLACGVKEYWLIDPRNRSMELRINKGVSWETISGEKLESRLLPGWIVSTEEL